MKALLLAIGFVLLGISGASALDCAAPAGDSSAGDSIKVICDSPEAMAAMAETEAALAAASKLVTPDAAKTLADDQATWLDGLGYSCVYDDEGAELAPDAMAPCLIQEIRARKAFLSGAPLEGPGAPEPIVPVALIGADGTVDHLVRFADPKGEGEKLFNLEMDAVLETIQIGAGDEDYTDYLEVTLTYASPRLISARVELAYLGPQYAHPMPSVYGVTIDLTTGKKLTSDDAFTVGASMEVPLVDKCTSELADYIAPQEDGADDRKYNVALMAKDITNWHFGATAATAEYLDYFLETPITCTFPYSMLKPLLKPGFPLPE